MAIGVVDTTANAPPMTEAARRFPKSDKERSECDVLSVQQFKTLPGQGFGYTVDLSKYFLLDPGKPYTVKVVRPKGVFSTEREGKPFRALVVSLKAGGQRER